MLIDIIVLVAVVGGAYWYFVVRPKNTDDTDTTGTGTGTGTDAQ